MMPDDAMRLLSLDDILRRPEMLVGQSSKEIAETKIAAAAVAAALNAATADAPEPAAVVEDRPLSVDEALEMFSGVISRRWLFENDSLPFIRRLSRKRLAICEPGLRRYLAGRKH